MTARGPAPADLVLTGTSVYTVDAARRWASAVAMTDGRVVAVGTDGDVKEWTGPATRVVELPGRMVLPGFQDAHVHALFGGLVKSRCDLHEVWGRQPYLDTIARYAADHPRAPWIVGGGWAMDAFPHGTPHRSLLDAIVPDRPVYLTNRDVHGAWVNTRALELAGVTRSSPDPSGGRIERDPDGEPSGTLHEHAMDLVESVLPPTGLEERTRALARAQGYLHSLGITAWHDPWITRDELHAYRELAAGGELTARVVLALLWDRDRGEDQVADLLELRREGTLGRVRASTVKIFQDGVVENFTAAMIEPYLDESGRATDNRGISMIDPEALTRHVARLDGEGFQVHVHAIGDRAVREALDAFEAATRANGRTDARHTIAHIQVIDPADIPRFRRLGVVANAQMLWACEDGQMRDLTIPFLGPERSARQYPFASLRRAGATLACGSDWTVSTPNPLLQMEVGLTRVPPDERGAAPFHPRERLDLPSVLEAFTIGSAYVNHLERETGSLEPGKLADIVVLDRNLFDAAERVGDARVLLTLVEGQAVYAHPSLGW